MSPSQALRRSHVIVTVSGTDRPAKERMRMVEVALTHDPIARVLAHLAQTLPER